MVLVDGKMFNTMDDMAESVGVSATNFRRRMRVYNMSLAEVYEYYKNKYDGKNKYIIDGKVFLTKKAALDFVGIGKHVVNNRINETGESFEEVCEYYLEKKKMYFLGGVQFSNIDEICEFLNISKPTWYKHRRVHHADIEETFNYYQNKLDGTNC